MKKVKLFAALIAVITALSPLAACKKPEAEAVYKPKSFAEMELLHHTSTGEAVDNYRDTYVRTPFFSDKDDSVTYTVNAMYDIFTLANKWYRNNTGSGEQIVHRFGGSTPKYFEWMAQKSFWTDDTALKNYVRETLINYPIMQRGQFWTWHYSPRWPVSANAQNGSFHYDDQFRFISAVKQIMVWEQSTSILDAVDTTLYSSNIDDQGNPIAADEMDVSVNKTVREKLDMCVGFILENLGGKNGLIIFPGENTGKRASKSSNYFDSYAYGNKSAYENQLFYHALEDLIDIETMYKSACEGAGETVEAEQAGADIAKYNALIPRVKESFDREFWDSEKQRYIATIDTDGVRWDFGMTIQNLEAVTYGIASGKEKQIMSWINGTREIKSDTSTGKDIYYHKISPRSNTLKIETSQVREDGEWKYWWHGMPEINPATNQKWNNSQVNGGILFWSSYYDLTARFKVLGAENAMNRYKAIADEYEVDLLFRDPANETGNRWQLGVIDEFPESGLVPLAYFNDMLGINARIDRLEVRPNMPSAYGHAGLNTLVFGGNTYKLTVYKNGNLTVEATADTGVKIDYAPMGGQAFTVKYLDVDGALLKEEDRTGKEFTIDASGLSGCRKITVENKD